MKRITGTTVLAGCAAIAVTSALAGCGTVQPQYVGTPDRAVSSASPSPSTSFTPEQRADADAASILKSFVAPPGAVALPAVSGTAEHALGGPASKPLTPDVVDYTSWWRVPGQPDTVLAWEKAHLPHRFTWAGAGTGDAGATQSRFVAFSLPGLTNVIIERELQVQAVATGTDQSLIRVDAVDTWVPAKSASERIPSTATVVTIAPMPGGGVMVKVPAPVTVTNAAKVRQIASLIDDLPAFPPGVFSCPADTGRGARMTFRASADGPVLAIALVNTTGCGGVSLTIGGKTQQPSLSGGSGLVKQALAIAGAHWAGYY